METPYLIKYYDALLDYSTHSVLTISNNPAAILYLNECMANTRIARSVNYPNYTNPKSFILTPFFLASIKPKNYPMWTWDDENRVFSKTKTRLTDKNLLKRSLLANNKNEVISNIMININMARRSLRNNTASQEIIYWAKGEQAKAFKDSGYDDALIAKCPYILQYADYAGISLRQATDDISFKAKLDNELLEKTELLRIIYFNKIKKATTSEELTTIFDQFMLDCYVNAQV